jgi:hypothetical protein
MYWLNHEFGWRKPVHSMYGIDLLFVDDRFSMRKATS